MKVLILGGTSESRALAAGLEHDHDLQTVTSLAGRVADPLLPAGESRVGGFGGVDGLCAWIVDNAIDVVVDATHPYAATMSNNAAAAALQAAVPLFLLRRPEWTPAPDDTWLDATSIVDAAEIVEASFERAFLTIGRQGVSAFAGNRNTWFLVRSIDPPEGAVPPRHERLLARGPFAVDDEMNLMRTNGIDVVVSKNSGGVMTEAKLDAARRLGVPVVMIARPPAPKCDAVADTVDEVLRWLRAEL